MTQAAERPVTSTKSTDCSGWADSKLVRGCLNGNQEAWSALVRRYQNLIFSVPLEYGFSREEAADVFHGVCMDLLSQLPKLREPRALQACILMLVSHSCHRRGAKDSTSGVEPDELRRWFQQALPPKAKAIIQKVQREQALRLAVSDLTPQCRKFVRLLCEGQARPCSEIAEELGIANSPTGRAQQKCLSQIRRKLAAAKIV